MTNRRWTDVFTRSRLSPFVFNVRLEHFDTATTAATELGLPTASTRELFSNWYWSTPILDGFVIKLETYGFPSGLPVGERVVGHRPFRLLCERLELIPPRRLAGETEVESPDVLADLLATQLRQPAAVLQKRAELGLGVSDRDSLLDLVEVARHSQL